MFTFEYIAVTDSNSCQRPLPQQIPNLANCKIPPKALILRAKNLNSNDYYLLAVKVLPLCKKYKIKLIIHGNLQTAKLLNIHQLHLPLNLLRTLPNDIKSSLTWLSCSVHSLSEAKEAQSLGATALIAGHIYATSCKITIPPRGINFLQTICKSTKLPVYAIGGIAFDENQQVELLQAGAKGACIMGAYMHL